MYIDCRDYIQREDGAIIPVSEDNRDYREYLEWVAEGNTAPAPTVTREQLLARIAARRWDAQSAGIVLNGTPISTDRDAQTTITSALLAWPESLESVEWKAADGSFLTVTKAQLQVILSAGFTYIQACFAREGELVAAVQASTYAEDMLDQGWPAREVGNAA